MRQPDHPEGRESIWARLEREDREEVKRDFWPLLIRTVILYFLIPVLAEEVGWPLPRGAVLSAVDLLAGANCWLGGYSTALTVVEHDLAGHTCP